jgi:L-iditol 2-dehydrogenase
MQAALFKGEGRIDIAEVEPPAPASGEVRVRIGACCLCGSDLRPLRQGWPVTPGHEIAGRVAEPGHRLDGQAVIVYIPVHCGACEECRAGATNICRNATDLIGWQRPGGYAELVNVPEQCLLPVPDDIPIGLAPLLLDTIGTAAHGLRLARRIVDRGRILLLGAGPIGLGALLVARRMGFGPVDLVEPNPSRARFAAALGACVVPADEVAGRYPLIVEASGKDAARQTALDHAGPLGAVVQLGEAGRWAVAETKAIRRNDFFYIRSFYFPKSEYEENLDLFRADREIYARFIDERASLAGLESLFGAFARSERIKPALAFPG